MLAILTNEIYRCGFAHGNDCTCQLWCNVQIDTKDEQRLHIHLKSLHMANIPQKIYTATTSNRSVRRHVVFTFSPSKH